MIFMKLSDYTDSIENVIFPKIFEKYASIIREGNCIAVKGGIPSATANTPYWRKK